MMDCMPVVVVDASESDVEGKLEKMKGFVTILFTDSLLDAYFYFKDMTFSYLELTTCST